MNTQLLQKAKSLYESGLSLREVSLELNTPKATIRENLIKIIPMRGKSESRRINNYSLFKELNGESAYWLGFIAADGYINSKMIKIKLSIKDLDHLEKFRKFTGIDREISIQDNGSSCTFIVHSVNDVLDICKYLPSKDKTNRVDIPNISKELLPDFIRGYFDGDGHIGYKKLKKGHHRCMVIASVSRILYSLKELFDSLGIVSHVYPSRQTIQVSRKDSLEKFYNFCNYDKNLTRMDRKWNLFDKMIMEMK